MKIATVTTLNASLEDTLTFVNYHLNSGIDRIYLFFDNPYDAAIAIFKDHPQITCTACTIQHWEEIGCSAKSHIEIRQTLNADCALQWCRTTDIDWIAHIDVDELIYCSQKSTKDILATLEPNISYLSMQPLEAIPAGINCENPFKELKNFKVLIRDKEQLELLPRKNETLYLGEYLRGHLSGKSFTRVSDKIKSLNIHKPTAHQLDSLTEVQHDSIFILHYDCYNYENWLKKWNRRYDGTANFQGRLNRNKQFMEFVHALESAEPDQLIKLYKKLYLLSPETIELLKDINAVKTILINEGMFKDIVKK